MVSSLINMILIIEEVIIREYQRISKSNEINGAIFLRYKGRILFSSLKSNELIILLNEGGFSNKIML